MHFRTPIRCRSRICEDCGTVYWYKLRERMEQIVQLTMHAKRRGYYCSLLTLTVNKARFGDRMPDREDIARIYRESSEFFRLYCGKYRGVFTKAGKVREDRKHWDGAGSISVVEVGSDNNNLHVHAFVWMRYTPFSQLRRDWLKITGDSHVVNVKRAFSAKRAVRYILKYVTKPPQTESLNRVAEYAWMIKGSRRIRTSGTFYNHLKIERKPGLKCRCPYCSGGLKLSGIGEVAYMEKNRQNLFDLLRAREDRGENLPMPPWSWIWWRVASA